MNTIERHLHFAFQNTMRNHEVLFEQSTELVAREVGATMQPITDQGLQLPRLVNNDQSGLLMLRPEIPVGDRLTHFQKNWQLITTDKWVLSIIKEGYKLEFIKKPIFQGIKQTHVSIENEHIMQEEIDSLMQKNAIEIVPKTNWTTGFYSTLFLVKKKTGDLRPVINLKPLNHYLRKQHCVLSRLCDDVNFEE